MLRAREIDRVISGSTWKDVGSTQHALPIVKKLKNSWVVLWGTHLSNKLQKYFLDIVYHDPSKLIVVNLQGKNYNDLFRHT